MRTQKRQSDQRVAELETLLALQKYGAHHFLRSQSGDGEGSYFPAYGIIDFNKMYVQTQYTVMEEELDPTSDEETDPAPAPPTTIHSHGLVFSVFCCQ